MQPFREWVVGEPGGSAIAPRRPNPIPATRHAYGTHPAQFCDMRLPPPAAGSADDAALSCRLRVAVRCPEFKSGTPTLP